MSYMSGVPLNPQSIIPVDINISTLSYVANIIPPYQNVSSGSYTLFINSQSDVNLLSYDRGTFSNVGYYNYSTVADTLIGSSNNQFMFQNKNDFSYFPLVTRATPFITTGQAVAYNGRIYVAAGSGSNTIATSVDGISWVPRGLGIITTTAFTVTWNDSLWLVGGTSGGAVNTSNLATSPDGVTWTGIVNFNVSSTTPAKGVWSSSLALALFGQNSGDTFYYTSPTGSIWTRRSAPFTYAYNIAWNGYVFIMTGGVSQSSPNVNRSTDGISWTAYGVFSGVYTTGIVWSPQLGVWVCSGYNASGTLQVLAYSYNGQTWILTGPLFSAANVYYDVAWNGTYFLAAGASGTTPHYSLNGITWVSTGFAPASTIFALAWNGTVWVAGGSVSGTSMYYNTSPTASLAWTASTNVFTSQCYDIKYNGSILVAVGTGTNSVAYSTSGTSWVGLGLTAATFTSGGFGVLWAQELGLWMAAGAGVNRIITSPNGLTWTARDGQSATTGTCYGSAFSPLLNQWAIVGNGTAFIGTSTDLLGWFNNNTVFTTQGWVVIWSSVHNIWIAGGQGTNTLATSTDGIGWTARTSPISTAVYGLAFNGSIYVAVGTGTNVFASSTDGITWTARGSSGITTAGRAVAWASSLSLWVAVGSGTNSIATSPDGTTWSGITTTTIFATTGFGVNWSAALAQFIAAGQGTNTLATSKDGVNWLGFTGMGAILRNVYAIAWNGILWVAGGTAGLTGSFTIASSPDGINWTGRSTGVIGTVFGVAWSGSLWVAVGQTTNVFASSTDGQTWVGRGSTGITTAGRGVIWYPYSSLWVAVRGFTNSIATSPDGTTWTGRTGTGIFGNGGYGIAYFRNLIVAVGQSTNTYATSADGINWTGRGITGITGIGNSVAYSPTLSRWVAVGLGTNSIAYSDNGTTWVGVTGLTIFGTSGTSVIWNGTYFVATGTGTNVLATSADGITWRGTAQNNATTALSSLGYRAPIMVACGQGTNVLCYSTDNGNTWTQTATTAMTTSAREIAWNGNIWVSVGSGTNSIATSPDGITWTGRTTTTIFSTSGFDILWADSLKLWIAAGTGTNCIATSPDGINWTARVLVNAGSFGTGGYRIGWNGSQLVILGSGSVNSLALSTKGTAWTFVGAPITASTLGYGGIVWNGNIWAAVSDAATNIWTSSNGITWTSRATLTAGNCRSICWNGRQFLVIGASTYCATSTDGFTWTMLNTQPVTTLVKVTWNHVNTQWVVVGTATATLIYTTPDAVTWTLRQNAMITNATTQGFAWAPQLGLWALVGGTSTNLATASDGAGAWISRLTTQMGTAYCVAWNGSLFVAGGGTTVQIYTSPDGVNWTSQTTGGVAWTIVYGIAWSSSLSIWVAAGQNGASSGVLASSANGTAWTSRSTITFGAGGAAFDVAVNTAGNLFVAVGTVTNTFAYSSNGTTWNNGVPAGSITTAARGVVWVNSLTLWVAVGNGTNSIATSPDGITWTGRTGLSTFGTQGNKVATNNSVIVATGSGTNTYAYSYDGINWTAGGATLFTSTAQGIAWNSTTGQWLMGNGVNAYPYYASSPDGVNWTGRQTFTTSAFSVGNQLQREKTFNITNTNWTGRSTQQNFRIVSS